MKSSISLFLLLFCNLLIGANPSYHEVTAKSGDGIFSILRRYHLIDQKCNKEQFLNLNQLSIKDQLKTGKKYKLPILIYTYNGTSIRTSIGIDNWDQAIRIKKYNEKILGDNLRKTQYVDSKILWVPYHEMYCTEGAPKAKDKIQRPQTTAVSTPSSKSNTIPKSTKSTSGSSVKASAKASAKANSKASSKKTSYIKIDLFGKKNEMVELKDNSLKGKVYYIVSGHGGPDPGAVCSKACSNELCEDEYAYDVCLRLTRELISHGATAHMIIQDKNDGIRDEEYLSCDKDELCMGARIPANQKKRLHQRAGAINSLYKKYKKQGVKEQVALMVHVDSNTKDTRQDVYFYHHRTSKGSKKLAKSLQNTFKEKYNYYQKGRGYKGFVTGRGLYMLNSTLPTSAYVELANIRNPNDQKRIVLSSNREALAKWLFEGITDYK